MFVVDGRLVYVGYRERGIAKEREINSFLQTFLPAFA